MESLHTGKWEKRWHPLREEWIVYSAHRNARPWQGAGMIQSTPSAAYDPLCYLCPGNLRIHGHANPRYTDLFVFENDHPVVGKHSPEVEVPEDDYGLFRKSRAAGVSKVICYDPRHNVTLAQMKLERVATVFDAFRRETIELQKDPSIRSVFIFENKGEAVGVSNPHPHCQIYATDFTFKVVEQQLRVADEFEKTHRHNLFEKIIERETSDNIRILAENRHAIAFIPFFARYAYEVMIFPKKPHETLVTMSDEELRDLASVFHQVIRRMDMNFDMSFPYVMSVLQAPLAPGDYRNFRLHLWLQPPFRQPGLIKYLAGPEIGGGNFMADTMPEDKAAELRRMDLSQYKHEQ